MRNSFLFLTAIAYFISITGCDSHDPDNPFAGRETQLVWADEFDADGRPNPDNWGYERGFVRNNEDQWYQPENAWVEDGRLIIEGREERKRNPDYDPDSDDWRLNREYIEYTSSSLRTRDRQSWQFGRFEMKAKIVAEEGLWPAWWALGVEGSWPYNGEIDMMEYYDGVILANAAWGSEERFSPHWDATRTPIEELGENWDEEFHIWRMDWDEDYIRLYVDDRLLNEVDLSETINPDGTNPFHQPHYMLVNLAIGGNNGGDPTKATYPSRYEIEYIRVYEWMD